MIVCREILDARELAACREIRREVFIVEQNVPEAEEWDGLDPEARHWLVLDGDTPVATMRLRVMEGVGKVERVAVLKHCRGQGHGAALVRAALEAFAAMPAVAEVRLGAQLHAIAFYEALGFEAYGDEFMDGGMPHRMMRCAVP